MLEGAPATCDTLVACERRWEQCTIQGVCMLQDFKRAFSSRFTCTSSISPTVSWFSPSLKHSSSAMRLFRAAIAKLSPSDRSSQCLKVVRSLEQRLYSSAWSQQRSGCSRYSYLGTRQSTSTQYTISYGIDPIGRRAIVAAVDECHNKLYHETVPPLHT